jgi:acetyl esterase/lipase
MLRARSGWPAALARRWPLLLIALALLTLPACLGEVRLYQPIDGGPPQGFEVVRCRDIPYYKGPGADGARHRLDLFLPKDAPDYPVVVLVHGGAWIVGNNRCSGLYTSVGEFLASQGIAAALPNYRLSPGVKHPEHVRDIARAVVWVHSHIARRGGNPDRLFLVGHSAGGHLVSLLATDETYLRAEGLRTADIKGVISAGGVYDIPRGDFELTLGGVTAKALRLDELVPFRGSWDGAWSLPGVPGIPLCLDAFGPAFGDDPKVREQASPLTHVRPDLPPFLILSAAGDLPNLGPMAEEFHKALLANGCRSRLMKVAHRNHNSLFFRAVEMRDPVARAMVDFIRDNAGLPARPVSP